MMTDAQAVKGPDSKAAGLADFNDSFGGITFAALEVAESAFLDTLTFGV